MVRKVIRAGAFAALGMVALLGSYGVATSANRADVEVGEIMKKSFGKGGLKTTFTAAVKGEKWEDATKIAKELNGHAADLGKAKPPKGDAKSWETQTKKFAESAKTVLTAAEKKDADAAKKAFSFDCAGCHKAHKP